MLPAKETALIPYLQIPSIPIFDTIAIHPFGILVATGILVGARLTIRRGTQLGLQEDMVKNMIFWSVFTGFILAHFLDVLVYQTDLTFVQKLKQLADPRSGLSSMGGFAGAVLGMYAWCWRNRQRVLPYADSLAYGLAIGWMFGRMGCFVAHDHPGHLTQFFLGVDYPCPTPHCPNVGDAWYFVGSRFRRHDLGFDEVLVAAALSGFYFIMDRFRPRLGFYVAAIATYYGPVRFFLDYLRADTQEVRGADPRWLGLTPAQYAAIGVLLIGLYLCLYIVRRPAVYRLKDGDDPAGIDADSASESGK
jgi:phosphatidylglycerol:prolipoprotein diacylglycerol transferase